MNHIIEDELITFDNPNLKKIATHVKQAVQLAVIKATAHVDDPRAYLMPADPNAFENIILRRIQTLGSANRRRARSKLDAFQKLSPARRKKWLGAMDAVDLRSAEPVFAHPSAAKLREDLLSDRTLLAGARVGATDAPVLASAPNAAAAQPEYDRLSLRIHEVECIDETNPEWLGHDKILLGGFTIDETGDVTKIPALKVSDTFDDGDSRTYDPPQEFAAFNIREGGNSWPKTYHVTMVLAEQDQGGFPDFLVDLAKKAKEYIAGLLDGVVGVILDVTGLGVGQLGKLIASFVSQAMSSLLSFLKEVWEDDPFPGITVFATMHSLNQHFANGTRTSSIRVRTTSGHKGKYAIRFDWHLET